VVEMKGVPVQQSGGRRDAHISFDVAAKKFSGNGGCNQVNGNYSVDKKMIKFTAAQVLLVKPCFSKCTCWLHYLGLLLFSRKAFIAS